MYDFQYSAKNEIIFKKHEVFLIFLVGIPKISFTGVHIVYNIYFIHNIDRLINIGTSSMVHNVNCNNNAYILLFLYGFSCKFRNLEELHS